jgi:imidazolonepropionase-like amidohydrolase
LRTSHAILWFFCAAASAFLPSCATEKEAVLAITNGTVVDPTGRAPLAGQTVIVRGQRIVAVGAAASLRVPPRAHIVDATGKFLIPGLADLHIHLTAAGEPDGSRKFMFPLLLANGITTVRDMGGFLESLRPLRREIEAGKRLGPRMVYAGPYLDGSPPSFEPSLVVTNREQADQAVRQVLSLGADFIKVQSRLSREAYFAIAESSKEEHVSFVGHVPDRVTAAEAAEAGQRSVEHLTNVLRGCSREEPRLMRQQFFEPAKKETPADSRARALRSEREILESYSEETADGLIDKFVRNHVWQTPTLVVLKYVAFPTLQTIGSADPRLSYLPSNERNLWEHARSEWRQNLSPAESELHAELFRKSLSVVLRMQKAGVKILAGTDSPAPYVFPGFALHDELELLAEAGLAPREALEAATSNAAEFLGAAEDSGSIAAGKYADMVLLDANPLADIRNTQKIRAVILRGKLLDRLALDALLDGVRQSVAGEKE